MASGIHPKLAIFRRFGNLSAQNLIYLHAEPVHLEKELCGIEISDGEPQLGHSSSYAQGWYWLTKSASEEDSDQILIIHEIHTKLKGYNQFLQQNESSL